jgi:proteasome lid subunit RPN8/RPN11
MKDMTAAYPPDLIFTVQALQADNADIVIGLHSHIPSLIWLSRCGYP